jgi:pimeloyl-ACP methyl ester carboxylesterase
VAADARDRTVELPGGGVLAYRELGDPAAPPVLYFHGVPGSRLDADMFEGGAEPLRARVIAVDRPGFGGSTPQPGRRPVDWPADVRHLADALGLERFALLGFSSGGKFALACAHGLADRVSGVGVVAGVGPRDTPRFFADMGALGRLDFMLCRRLRPLARAYVGIGLRVARRQPRLALAVFERGLSEPDRELLRDPRVGDWALATTVESGRQGVDAAIDEKVMELLPWGFRLRDVQLPVRLWQGERDTIVPRHHSAHVSTALLHAQLTLVPGAGHLLVRRFAEFANAVAGA